MPEKYYVVYISSTGIQRSEPIEDIKSALFVAHIMRKFGLDTHIEDGRGNIFREGGI